MSKIGSKIKAYIEHDSSAANESGRILIVSRLIFVASFIFVLFTLFAGLSYYEQSDFILIIAALIINVIMFLVTYKLPRTAFLVLNNICCISIVTLFVIFFGWNSGVQGFLFVILAVTVFATYKDFSVKIGYSILLLILRIVLYAYCQYNDPRVASVESFVNLIQIASSVTIFFSLLFVCLVYGVENQKVESKLVEYNIKLENEANTDALTGLANRRRGVEYVQNFMDKNPSTPISLAMCDIDFFKKVNDNYGHDVGDAVLKGVADVISEMLDETTFACRWGGEEFILIFCNCNGDEAFVKLVEFQKQIRCLLFKVYEKSFTITMTMGLEEYDYKSSLEDFVKKADEKLYYGKEHGRDQIVF